MGKRPKNLYDPMDIVDALEFHPLAKAMGILSTTTWNHQARSFEQRKQDFVYAFPPDEPTRFMGTELRKTKNGSYQHASREALVKRFFNVQCPPGGLYELLSRYGLKLRNGPLPAAHAFEPAPLLPTARKRNHKLRVLHGGVDVEAKDMDAAKAEWLDRQEKRKAADQIRVARKRMREELDGTRKRDD